MTYVRAETDNPAPYVRGPNHEVQVEPRREVHGGLDVADRRNRTFLAWMLEHRATSERFPVELDVSPLLRSLENELGLGNKNSRITIATDDLGSDGNAEQRLKRRRTLEQFPAESDTVAGRLGGYGMITGMRAAQRRRLAWDSTVRRHKDTCGQNRRQVLESSRAKEPAAARTVSRTPEINETASHGMCPLPSSRHTSAVEPSQHTEADKNSQNGTPLQIKHYSGEHGNSVGHFKDVICKFSQQNSVFPISARHGLVPGESDWGLKGAHAGGGGRTQDCWSTGNPRVKRAIEEQLTALP
ncbi:hypothetical protein B0H10DRAFT_2192287 [Mycena sp. CBHHK59/15]|nr:hypothetical protein B0H10DRAFT_2192287 [Mycena sp. CBHHK59/15]